MNVSQCSWKVRKEKRSSSGKGRKQEWRIHKWGEGKEVLEVAIRQVGDPGKSWHYCDRKKETSNTGS
jgi:hypothetical protein